MPARFIPRAMSLSFKYSGQFFRARMPVLITNAVLRAWQLAPHQKQFCATLAAAQNNAAAQYNLGYMYEQGEGVTKNSIQAQEWYGKACDNGNQDGCDGYKILNLQ